MELVDNYAKFRSARRQREAARLRESVFGPSQASQAEKDSILREHAAKMATQAKDEKFKKSKAQLDKKEKNLKKIKEFGEILRGSLLAEALAVPFDQIAALDGYNEHQTSLGHGIIESIIAENGIGDLLFSMQDKNVYLCEYANEINDLVKVVMESSKNKCKECPDDETDICYTLDKDYADKFIHTIQGCTPTKLAGVISKRVEDAVTHFVDQNSEAKQQIKDIYTAAKAKIGKTTNEAVIKDYTVAAKKKVASVYGENTNLYGAMVRQFSETMIKDPKFKEAGYVNESGSLNVGKVLNDTRVMYTVLEMVNTMGLIDVDRDYVVEHVLDMK